MRFEQGFYTRGSELLNTTEAGLGIAAASIMEKSFWDDCMSVGGKFDTERSGEQAEFVLYSDKLDTFVGVAVNPAKNEDGGIVNKLCHIFIPAERCTEPEDYILEYPFRKEVEKAEALEAVELSGWLTKEDFSKILDKYQFDEGKLTFFIHKICEIVFGERNFMYMVLDTKVYPKEGFSQNAQELTWLANYLVPASGEDALQLRKRLSYCVNSHNNQNIVNLGYVAEAEVDGERQQFLVTGANEIKQEIAEVYYTLARKALISLEAFEDYVNQLRGCFLGKKIDDTNLKIAYINWKIKENQPVTEQDFPYGLDFIILKAGSDEKYLQFLKACMERFPSVSGRNLKKVWADIVRPVLKGERNENRELADMAAFVLNKLYEGDYDKYCEFYKELKENRDFEQKVSMALQSIDRHLEKITTIEEYMDVLKLYQGRCKTDAVLREKMRQKAQAEDIYFLCGNQEDRSLMSDIFGSNSISTWREYVGGKIRNAFQSAGFISFAEREIGVIEEAYVTVYFRYLLENCKRAEGDLCTDLKTVMDKYQEYYAEVLEKSDKRQYEEILKAWKEEENRNRFRKEIGFKALPALVKMSLQGEDKGNKTLWCEKVSECLETSIVNTEIVSDILEQFPLCLECKPDIVANLKRRIWNAHSMRLKEKLMCSVVFCDDSFCIWNCIDICEKETQFTKIIMDFQQIRSCLAEYPAYASVESKSMAGVDKKAEFKRCCYVLWKTVVEDACCNVEPDIERGLKCYPEELWIFVTAWQKSILTRIRGNEYLLYFKLGKMVAKLTNQDVKSKIYEDFALLYENRTLWKQFFAAEGSQDQEMETLRKYAEIYDKLYQVVRERKKLPFVEQLKLSIGAREAFGCEKELVKQLVDGLEKEMTDMIRNPEKTKTFAKEIRGMAGEAKTPSRQENPVLGVVSHTTKLVNSIKNRMSMYLEDWR